MNEHLQIELLAQRIAIGRYPRPENVHKSLYDWDLMEEEHKDIFRLEAAKLIEWMESDNA
jgi:hypothetical protein